MGCKRNILIWGTGLKGQSAFELLSQYTDTYNIVAFGDNDKNKVGDFFCNKKVINAEKICERDDIDMVLLATSAKDLVRRQLQHLVSIPIYDNVDRLIFTRVAIDISGFCNAKCKYCVTGRKNRSGRDIDRNKYMNFKLFTQLYEHLISNQIIMRETEIMLYNWGEPFLNPDYIKIIEYLADNKQKFSVSTNASVVLLADKKNAYESCVSFVVSMPGFSQQSYDKIHQFNFSIIKNNISRLANNLYESGFRGEGSISWHVYKFNMNEIEDGRKFAESLNFQFNAYYPYFNGLSMAQKFLEKKTAIEQDNVETELFLDHVDGLLKNRPADYRCFLENILSIDYKGNLALCCASDEECENFEWTTAFEIGSLSDMLDFRRKMLQCNTCNICRKEGYDYWMEKNPSYREKKNGN